LVGTTLGANVTHQAAHGGGRIAQALGHCRLRRRVNADGTPGFSAAVQWLLRFEVEATGEGGFHHQHAEL
jgi:hypothetical protein